MGSFVFRKRPVRNRVRIAPMNGFLSEDLIIQLHIHGDNHQYLFFLSKDVAKSKFGLYNWNMKRPLFPCFFTNICMLVNFRENQLLCIHERENPLCIHKRENPLYIHTREGIRSIYNRGLKIVTHFNNIVTALLTSYIISSSYP